MRWSVCTLILLLSVTTQGKERGSMQHTEVSPKRIIGALGQPLGTVVTIAGQVTSGDELRTKAMAGKLLLQVTTVDGKKLTNPAQIEFDIPLWASVARPDVGQSFLYIGYETGGMSGVPFEIFKHVPPMTSDGFHFSVHFVVCKVVKK